MKFRKVVIKKIILLSLILFFGCSGIFGIVGDGKAQVSCATGPTPNFPTGCDLLLNYDVRVGTEGKIDAGELTMANIDEVGGIITMDELNFIVLASAHLDINDLCAGCYSPSTSSLNLNLPDKSISDIIEDLINWILTIAVVVAIIMLIVGGILYIMAAGDETRILLAKKIVTYAILGLLVIGLSYVIVKETANIIEGIA